MHACEAMRIDRIAVLYGMQWRRTVSLTKSSIKHRQQHSEVSWISSLSNLHHMKILLFDWRNRSNNQLTLFQIYVTGQSSIQQDRSRYRDLSPPSALIWIFNMFIFKVYVWLMVWSIVIAMIQSIFFVLLALSASAFAQWNSFCGGAGTHTRLLISFARYQWISSDHLNHNMYVPLGYDVSSLIGKELTLTTNYVWVSKFEHCTLAWYRTIKAALTNDLLIWLFGLVVCLIDCESSLNHLPLQVLAPCGTIRNTTDTFCANDPEAVALGGSMFCQRDSTGLSVYTLANWNESVAQSAAQWVALSNGVSVRVQVRHWGDCVFINIVTLHLNYSLTYMFCVCLINPSSVRWIGHLFWIDLTGRRALSCHWQHLARGHNRVPL